MENSIAAERHPYLYFLDTSTQIGRRWADEETSRRVRADLFGKKLRCSIYVEREYRCRVLNTLISVHTFVAASKDIQEAEERLQKCKQFMDALVYKVSKRLLKKYNSKKALIRYLEKLIEVDWENFFYDGVPRSLCDMTNCTRGADAPKYQHGYYLTIRTKCPNNCKICDFWKSKEEDLRNLGAIDPDMFTQTDDPKGTMGKIQNEAQSILGGKSPHGNACRNVSDAVISIEARDGYPGITIHTMDYDFELLKNILNTQVRLFKVYKTV